MTVRFSLWLKLFGVIALPFVLVNGSYAFLAVLIPSTVKVAHWETAGSSLFIVNIALIIWVLVRTQLNFYVRLALGATASLLMLFSAMIMQSHWNCGEPRPIFIGETPVSEAIKISSCN